MKTEIYTSLLEKLASVDKKAFVPGEQVGQPQVDPMTGMPIDPATGMPIDPATGMPIDPAMMEQMMAGGGAMPPGAMPPDPSMGGMPPGAMPTDPSMGGMPPEVPAPSEGGGSETGTGAPATVDDLAILEERVSGLEDVIEDLVDTIEALGGKKLSDAKVDAASSGSSAEPAEAVPAAPAVPGPFGSSAGEALAAINPGATGATLNNLMGRLSELKAV